MDFPSIFVEEIDYKEITIHEVCLNSFEDNLSIILNNILTLTCFNYLLKINFSFQLEYVFYTFIMHTFLLIKYLLENTNFLIYFKISKINFYAIMKILYNRVLMNFMEIYMKTVLCIQIVGRGAFGVVSRAQWRGSNVAVKLIETESERKVMQL